MSLVSLKIIAGRPSKLAKFCCLMFCFPVFILSNTFTSVDVIMCSETFSRNAIWSPTRTPQWWFVILKWRRIESDGRSGKTECWSKNCTFKEHSFTPGYSHSTDEPICSDSQCSEVSISWLPTPIDNCLIAVNALFANCKPIEIVLNSLDCSVQSTIFRNLFLHNYYHMIHCIKLPNSKFPKIKGSKHKLLVFCDQVKYMIMSLWLAGAFVHGPCMSISSFVRYINV